MRAGPGQLAGDSLGGLVEFQSPERIRAAFPDGVRDLIDGGTWRNLAGQPTDDSEMALMLARTLVHVGSYEPGAALDAYAHWWPVAWDRGNTLRQALREVGTGKNSAERLEIAARCANRTSQSNGCLMRISPLGIFGYRRPTEAGELARVDAGLTHPHEVCQEACAAHVRAVATGVAGGSALDCHQAALAGATGAVRERLEAARLAPPADYCEQMGWVLIALQNAFYQLLHAATFEAGVVDTVMQGGDTDTNGAIAGALLGAVHGRAGIPSRWLLALQSCRPLQTAATEHAQAREFWPVDALELAEALVLAGSAEH